PPARVGHLLGDVAARLEPVVLVEADQARGEEGAEVRAVAGGAEAVEEDAEVVLALEEDQVEPDAERAGDLGDEADLGRAREVARAAEVDQRGEPKDD